MYFNNGGSSWSVNTGWSSSSDHCTWTGITCSVNNEVVAINLVANDLSGTFPTDLNNLGSLESLDVHSNGLVGTVPTDLCERSVSTDLHIYADSDNCPAVFDAATGTYLNSCCDDLLVDVDLYLQEFATAVFGDANCVNLDSTETEVCNYMISKNNHAIFTNGFPTDFPGVWDWLKVRTVSRFVNSCMSTFFFDLTVI